MDMSGSSDDASTASGSEALSAFDASLRDKLGLWVESIPPETDPTFQDFIQRSQPINRPFEPKDEHCGTWQTAPNKECHASFGDQGTTATLSCSGDIVQITQFLGLGNSGLFSLDHELTEEPYQVVSRADDLKALSINGGNPSFGFSTGRRFWPDQIPNMKWVNWRWPRFEWQVSEVDTSAKLSYQWVVKNNTVFQQVTVENTGSSPIEDFWFGSYLSMLIRDLDYLGEPSYNKRGSNSYTRGLGPNGFSWITANLIKSEESDTNKEDDKNGDPETRASDSDHEKQPGHWPNEVKHPLSDPLSDEGLWRTRRMSDTWSTKNPHAVVSIMSVFVDGTAEKMQKGPHCVDWKRTLGPSGSSSSVLEITIAYKTLSVPKEELPRVDWKNFLIPAATADVTAMLAAETEELWGHSAMDVCNCKPSLFDREISMQGNKKRHAEPLAGIATKPSQGLSPIGSIEYLTWRHTEHILSVCFIPLSAPHLQFKGKGSDPDAGEINVTSSGMNPMVDSEEIRLEAPLALTCGDISGHRICTSSSFFAFKFLMGVLERLSSVECTPYIETLSKRIDAACRGHIRWLEWVRKPWCKLEGSKSLLRSGCFAANYWVSGEKMPEGGESWQPDDSITDTPFQVLKVTAYVKWLQKIHEIEKLEDERLRLYMALLRDVWPYWIHELDDLDKRKAYAWRHASEDGLNTYRLDDHAWLWNALTELHSLEFWSLTKRSKESRTASSGRWVSYIDSLSPNARLDGTLLPWKATSKGAQMRDPFAEFDSKARRLQPREVQRAVLQRFTVENDVSQERMLAVTRSARETRFFFHSRDTALFYAHELGFFHLDTSFSKLWERTIKSQKYHEEAVQEEWQSPLRSALGAVAALKGFAIDKRETAELLQHSVQALIQASDRNAFIPGEVDVSGWEPSIFSDERDRDYYYHVGFEASYILLKYAQDVDVAFLSENSPGTAQNEGESGQIQRETVDLLTEILSELRKHTSMNYPHANDFKPMANPLGVDGRFDRKPTPLVMKKSMPFNRMIDASSITTLDEEWLYNYPDFLLIKDIDVHREVDQLIGNADDLIGRLLTSSASFNSIIHRELWHLYKAKKFSFREVKAGDRNSSIYFRRIFHDGMDGLVASLPKQKRRRQRRGKHDIAALLTSPKSPKLNETLWDLIGKARSAADAKKRFIWLPARSDPQTAFLCWLASTEVEKPAISLFFDRHAAYDNQLLDDTTMVLNTWQTELHMCFWVLFDKTRPLHIGIPDQVTAPWPRDKTKELRRASIGFRFYGDFFDRYWTCHFIEFVPGLDRRSDGVPKLWTPKLGKEKHSWQRKVLELQLLQYILRLMLSASNNIFEEIKKELGLKTGEMILSVLNTEAYSKSADHWQIYEELLSKAEEDMTSSLSTLSKWATREEDRGQERPRWTRNDERKYRGYINKLRSQTERQRWDLERSRDKIRKLSEVLATYQTKIRSDLETKREQNIAYFTYVTVIFLPLGFAASFYSMNGVPTNDLIRSLAKFSAAAFAVTTILLFSAGAFIDILSAVKGLINHAILLPLEQFSHNTRQQSFLFRRHPDRVSYYFNALPSIYWKDWMDSAWFWPAYLLVEMPTQIVASARTALGAGIVSVGAVWKTFIGMVVLPIYLMSRAVLSISGNIMVLSRFPENFYRLSRLQRAKDKAAKTDGVENDTVIETYFPDHFKRLIPTAEPLNLLSSRERKLRRSIRDLEADEMNQ